MQTAAMAVGSKRTPMLFVSCQAIASPIATATTIAANSQGLLRVCSVFIFMGKNGSPPTRSDGARVFARAGGKGAVEAHRDHPEERHAHAGDLKAVRRARDQAVGLEVG